MKYHFVLARIQKYYKHGDIWGKVFGTGWVNYGFSVGERGIKI